MQKNQVRKKKKCIANRKNIGNFCFVLQQKLLAKNIRSSLKRARACKCGKYSNEIEKSDFEIRLRFRKLNQINSGNYRTDF